MQLLGAVGKSGGPIIIRPGVRQRESGDQGEREVTVVLDTESSLGETLPLASPLSSPSACITVEAQPLSQGASAPWLGNHHCV